VTHPVFDEILRARLPIREDVFKRWQQEIRAIVNTPDPQPKSAKVSA
jgi:hypothetical protein